MNDNLRTLLTGVLLICSVLACTDHRLNPVAPSGLRLKTTLNVNSGSSPFNTEYTYGSNNRVTSFTTTLGTKGVFTYDEKNQYKQFNYFYQLADESRGERTLFQYSQDGNSLTVNTNFFENGNQGSIFKTTRYEFDADKRLLGSSTGDGPGSTVETSTYQYTGGNITSQSIIANGTTRITAYEYDDKPNPYYGLIAPDIGEIRRFSRNNVTKITDVTPGEPQRVFGEYFYEYNAQGLPQKQILRTGTQMVLFTYESY